MLLALACHRLLPESPDFLASQHRDDEVATLLIKLRPDRQAIYANAVFREPSARNDKPNPVELLTPQYRYTSALLWLCGWLSLFASYGLSGWLPIVMLQRGETLDASFLFGSLLMASNAVGAVGGGYLADALGSRTDMTFRVK